MLACKRGKEKMWEPFLIFSPLHPQLLLHRHLTTTNSKASHLVCLMTDTYRTPKLYPKKKIVCFTNIQAEPVSESKGHNILKTILSPNTTWDGCQWNRWMFARKSLPSLAASYGFGKTHRYRPDVRRESVNVATRETVKPRLRFNQKESAVAEEADILDR